MKKNTEAKKSDYNRNEFAPPSSILFMAELQEEILRKSKFKTSIWWRYIDDMFFLWEHEKEKLKSFIDSINKMQHSRQIGQNIDTFS